MTGVTKDELLLQICMHPESGSGTIGPFEWRDGDYKPLNMNEPENRFDARFVVVFALVAFWVGWHLGSGLWVPPLTY